MTDVGISIDYKSLRKVVDTAGKLKSEGLGDLAVTINAFANEHDGKIVIRIEDKGKQPPLNQTKYVIINRGEKKGREYLVNPKLIASSKINIKPTLKTIEQPRLKALIEEVLKITPSISIKNIHSKIGDIDITDVRKCVYKMVKEEVLDTTGAKTDRVYFLAIKKRIEKEN